MITMGHVVQLTIEEFHAVLEALEVARTSFEQTADHLFHCNTCSSSGSGSSFEQQTDPLFIVRDLDNRCELFKAVQDKLQTSKLSKLPNNPTTPKP